MTKILLVEDSRFLKAATERALSSAGYIAISAGDGELGLRLAHEHLPALILLDVMLPKLSGPEAESFEKGSRNGGDSGNDAD